MLLEVTDRAWPLLLERVCQRRAITPFFQPIVDLARGVVCGYEGLSRIQEDGVDAGPEAWFAAAAWHGYATRLEVTALEVILAERAAVPGNCFLSVNSSPATLMTDEFLSVLGAQTDLSGLVIEITEQSPVEDYAALMERCNRLRERGAQIAVDDTGAGYAGFRHLLTVRPEIVKLDRSLVSNVDNDPSRAAAVSALGAFAGVLDAFVIAEGVERASELERLIGLGVPLVQGYYLGKPAPAMLELAPQVTREIQARLAQRRSSALDRLARPALVASSDPDLVAETTVLVDGDGRPVSVFEPGGGRRFQRHAAMRVQTTEDLAQVALRAVSRRSEDRFSPVCLCNDLGQFVGLIGMETVLEQLAADAHASAEARSLT
jgi:EAL domain-containing protein (putative c-di-GMP-specific phosphodiesterase class I)